MERDSLNSVDTKTVFTSWRASLPQVTQWLCFGVSIVTFMSCLMGLYRKVNSANRRGYFCKRIVRLALKRIYLTGSALDTANRECSGSPDRSVRCT